MDDQINNLENIAKKLKVEGFFKNKKIKKLIEQNEFIDFSNNNVVYLIFNKFSNNFYIGETKREFRLRIKEHLKSIGKKDMKLHQFMKYSDNYIFYILKKCNNDIDRKRLERKLIKLLNPDLNSFYKNKTKSIHPKGNVLNLTEYWNGNEKCFCLNFFTNSTDNIEIKFKNGNLDISNWRTVYDHLKESNIELNGKAMKFSKFEKEIKKLNEGIIKIKKNIFNIQKYRREINVLMKQPELFDESDIKKLWKDRKNIKTKNIRNDFKRKIIKFINWKLDINIKNFVLKIPFSANINKKDVKKEIMTLLYDLPKFIRKIINSKISIVFTKRNNIEDILCNHRRFSRNISYNDPVCSCGMEDSKAKKHVIIKLEDSNLLSNEEKKLIRLKDIPLPHSPNNYYNMKIEINNFISKFLKEKNMNLLEKINLISKKLTKQKYMKNMNKFILEKEIINIKTKLKKWIIAPIDKNNGAAVLICPVLYKNMLLENFKWIGGKKKYKRKMLHTQVIIAKMKTFGKKYPNISINKNGVIPNAYILPKNKDVRKTRPIVSYSNHPIRNLLKVASRGLFHVLKHAPIKHFSITKTHSTMEFIKNIDLIDNGKNMLIKGDIKEMFTNLDHNELIKTINWYTKMYKKYTKDEFISIKLRGRIETHSGIFNKSKKCEFKYLTLEEIKEIAIFDITNAYLKLGGFVLQQVKGIPMGSPLSPILAIMYCARAENYFLESLDTRINIRGVRYIDDLLLVLSCNKEEASMEIIDNSINDLKGLYNNGSGVELQIEDWGKHLQFLENEIYITNDKVYIEYFNKNGIKRYITRFKSYKSYEPKIQKIGMIIGYLKRIERLSTSTSRFMLQVKLIIQELLDLHYPKGIIKKAIHGMENSRKEIWEELNRIKIWLGK